MPKPIIDEEICVGCGVCEDSCPTGVLDISSGYAEVANPDDCVGCGSCLASCPASAITDIEQ